MLEAGEIVVATLGVATLFFLCCGIMACMMMFDKDKKDHLPRPDLDRALPPVHVQPMFSEKSTETMSRPPIGWNGRRRRDSGTQTEDNQGIVVQEDDLRTESSYGVRPQTLHHQRRLQLDPVAAEAVTTQHHASEFLSDLRQLRQSPHSVLADEFEILRRRAQARWKAREVSGMHSRQNRFEDVVPYDDNRVPLARGQYINASFIDSYLSSKHFIATQWPLGYEELPSKEPTVEQFWQMVWEHRVQVLVSISGMNDSLPAFWPPFKGVRRFGEVTVEQDRSYEEAGVLVRLFTVQRRGEQRRIHQFHITDWEDGSVPDEDKVLLVSQKVKDYPKPILVHCSAGIGRTGVFIAVCRLLSQASQRGLIDVFSVVDAMRQQRVGMVQTEEQYESIYDILRAAVETRIIAKHSRI